MSDIREALCGYGKKISDRGFVAGAGGNISAREGGLVWMKPSGMAMDEMEADDLVGVDLESGRVTSGKHKPTSEVNMHLAVYRNRPDATAIFHTHSPWASGILSSQGGELRAMFAEFVCDLGRTALVPYITPTTDALADAVGETAKNADTIFMRNHGICALGTTLKQAFYRVWVVEDAAKSAVAAKIMGGPVWLTQQQIDDLNSLDAPRHRVAMMEGKTE